jgi:2-acylglycerol O-acyltransferase 2
MAPDQTRHYCLYTFGFPSDALELPEADQRKVVEGITKVSGPGGFRKDELTAKAPITFLEEAAVICVLAVIFGGPLLLLPTFLYCLFLGWKACAIWMIVVLVLALHPLPKGGRGQQSESEVSASRSAFTLALYRYFSYRFVWSGDTKEQAEKVSAWIGAGPPHGVLPFANVLSIPAINTFVFRHFVGAGASVVPRTPFLRYMSAFGLIDASAKSIAKALDEGTCVGLAPDGIAGIFRCTSDDEVVVLKHRKGIAKLALRTGHPILPAYSVGNTAAFSAWFDPFGILERVSRAAQVALFIYWGRFYLPIPRRANITMLVGRPIMVDKVEAPTDEQVDKVHQRLLSEMAALFEEHKAALGWGHKKIIFE